MLHVGAARTLLAGSFPGGRLARPCLLRRRLWMEALGKHPLACRPVPLFILLVGDLALDEQLCELSALRLALEGHEAEASKGPAQGFDWSPSPALLHSEGNPWANTRSRPGNTSARKDPSTGRSR